IARSWGAGGSASPTWRRSSGRTWGRWRTRRSSAVAPGWSCAWRCSSIRCVSGRPKSFCGSGRGRVANGGGGGAGGGGLAGAGGGGGVAETRRWVMRDLRGGEAGRGATAGLSALLERFGESRIEEWGEDVWEAFTLQALWRVCCERIAGVPELSLPPLLPP